MKRIATIRDLDLGLLERLSEAFGPTGYEDPVTALFAEAVSGLVDDYHVDPMGNIIAHKQGEGPRVVIAGHADEIGFLVQHIDEKTGFLRVAPLGGFDVKTLVAQRCLIQTRNGVDGPLVGSIGCKPIHVMTPKEREKMIEMRDLFVSVLGFSGVKDKLEEVARMIDIGAPIVLQQEFIQQGDMVSGKAMDDRVALFIMVELLRALDEIGCDLYLVGSVQEEVGTRGATTAGFTIDPDISIAIDVGIGGPMPDLDERQQITIGKGPAVALLDKHTVSSPRLARALMNVAASNDVPYQVEVADAGGTDAGALQRAKGGSLAATISIPCRYVHSVVEDVHLGDVASAINLLANFCRQVSELGLLD